MDVTALNECARLRRLDIIKMDYMSSGGHVGGALSCIDIMVALYFDAMREKDRFVLSKGHCAEALYSVLAAKGFFPQEKLMTYCQEGSRLYGHPTRKVPGVEINSGSLGHGLPVSLGMAIAHKMDNNPGCIFVMLGDGELGEGSNWEAAMAAGHKKMDNLVAIVDRNRLQITGNTEEVLSQDDVCERFASFGWAACEVDGHDMAALCEVLKNAPLKPGKPTLICANTTKGKGVSFMENDPSWHHGVMSRSQYIQALHELGEEVEL